MCTRWKNHTRPRPTAQPATTPVRIETGTESRLQAEKLPPRAREVKAVNSTMTNTSSTEAPARIIWGMQWFWP